MDQQATQALPGPLRLAYERERPSRRVRALEIVWALVWIAFIPVNHFLKVGSWGSLFMGWFAVLMILSLWRWSLERRLKKFLHG